MTTTKPTTLWDVPVPARRGHRTQQAGAADVAARAPGQRERVLAFIASRPEGATIEEISDALALRVSSVCGRVSELRSLEAIRERGLTRKNKSGVDALVWVAYVGATA